MATLVEYSPRLQRAVDNSLRGSSTSRMPPHRPGREIGTEARPSDGGAATLAKILSMSGDHLNCALYENGATSPATKTRVDVYIPQAAATGLSPSGWIMVFPVNIGTAGVYTK